MNIFKKIYVRYFKKIRHPLGDSVNIYYEPAASNPIITYLDKDKNKIEDPISINHFGEKVNKCFEN